MKKAEAEERTRALATYLKDRAMEIPGCAEMSDVDDSGNAMEGDAACVFEFTIDGASYNVEVFGPRYEES